MPICNPDSWGSPAGNHNTGCQLSAKQGRHVLPHAHQAYQESSVKAHNRWAVVGVVRRLFIRAVRLSTRAMVTKTVTN